MSAVTPSLVDVTQWLQGAGAQGGELPSRLFECLYDDLRRVARNMMWREDSGHTLSATSLTHEAWFRLHGQSRTQWQSRSHFLAVASVMMRRILINHAAAKRAEKRAADCVPLTLAAPGDLAVAVDRDVLAVHEALLAFETVDARAARVVELRFFGGMELEEIAEALDISVATVKRDWSLAKAWLHRALSPSA